MRKALKVLVVLLALMMTLMGVAACGDDGPRYTKDNKKLLSFKAWGGKEEREVFNKLVNEFNEANPDIKVEYDPYPSESVYIDNISKRVQTGNGMPDIFFVPDGEYKSWAMYDNFLDLTSYVEGKVEGSEAFDTEDLWDSALPRYMYDKQSNKYGEGSIHALPKDIGPTVIFYNKSIMEAAGVKSPVQKFNAQGEIDPNGTPDPEIPMTWGEMLASAESATNNGSDFSSKIYGFYSLYWFAFNWSNGGDIMLPSELYDGQIKVGDHADALDPTKWLNGEQIARRDKDKFSFDTEAASQAMNFYASLFTGKNNYFNNATDLRTAANAPELIMPTKRVSPSRGTTNSNTTDSLFETGKIGMIVEGRYKVPTYRKNCDFDWDVVPQPVSPYAVQAYRTTHPEATEKEARLAVSSGHSGSVGLSVSKKTHFPAEAYRFISYIAGKEGQTEQAKTGFNIPNQKSIANSDVFLQPGQKPANAKIFIHAAATQKEADWCYTPATKGWIHDKFFDLFNSEVIYGKERAFDELVAQQKVAVQQAIDRALEK